MSNVKGLKMLKNKDILKTLDGEELVYFLYFSRSEISSLKKIRAFLESEVSEQTMENVRSFFSDTNR